MIFHHSTGALITSLVAEPRKKYRSATMIADGKTKKKLYRNLSLGLQPCDWVATMVVSDIKLRLSPKNAPLTILAVISATDISVLSARVAAIGTNATIVPTLVPMHSETIQAEIKSPAKRNWVGRIASVRLTVASTAPIALALEAKAPARIKIHTMRSMFLCPAPLENSVIRSLSLIPLVRRMAMIDMVIKMTSIFLFSV